MTTPIVVVLMLLGATAAGAQETFFYDFEQSEEFADYEGLSTSNATAEIVAPGAGGEGHCVRLTSIERERYCILSINRAMPVVKNLVLSFDYRAQIEEGVTANYLGILFFDAEGKQYGRFDHRFSDEWRHAEVPFASLTSPNEGVLRVGLELTRLNLYGRAPDTGGMMTVWLDNIRLGVNPDLNVVRERAEISYSDPPMFVWERGAPRSRLQYSRSPEFPEGETMTVETPWNFHTPAQPIGSGEWFWRAWTETELTEGWSVIHRLHIPQEAHRFTTAPVDAEALKARPRPRLIDVAAERARLGTEGIARLTAQALSEATRPVPDDPPIWTEGDERWPAWIDWYRDVHGSITSATGRRLELMAQRAAITGDERVFEHGRAMALAVAAWDPRGGSAMNRGDIGAQHVLRGLSNAYDVLRDRLSEEERARLRDAIVARAEDFWASLNPLRGDAQNNHAWLRALALGQAGLVLAGDYDAAYEWAEYCRQLYLGQFLCSLGYQGDNNEGISFWSYGLSFIIEYADMMRTVCGIDLYRQPWLSQTGRFPMYCAPPGAWAVSFADTGKPNHGVRGPYSQSYVRTLGERTGDPYCLWYGGAQEPVNGVEPRPPADLPQSILYRFIGLGIANTSLVDGREGVTVAMHSGPYWAGHQHADQNAFVIHAYGEKLAIDSGYYDWYGSPHFKQYSSQTLAHNTVLVDGEGQAAFTEGADGRMAAWFDGAAHTWMVGDASDPEVYRGKLTRFDRRLLFVKPGIVVIDDLLAAPEPSRFQWLLHTVAPIELDERTQTLSVTSGAAAMAARILQPAELSFTITDRYPVHPYDGYGTVPVPEEKLAQEWHLTAETAPAALQRFLTAFDVRRSEAGGAVEISEIECAGGVGVQASDGAHTTTVLLAQDREPTSLSGGGVEARAEAAAVTTTADGELLTACLIAGGELGWQGELWLGVDRSPADASLLATAEGMLADLSLSEESAVRLRAAAVGDAVMVDGEPAEARREGALMMLVLPAGKHRVTWGSRPAQVGSHELPPLRVRVGEAVSELQGYARRRVEDVPHNWWGTVELPADDRYRLVIAGVTRAPLVTWDGREVELTLEGDTATGVLWDRPGAHQMTIGAAEPLGEVALQPLNLSSVAAEMLPKGWSPPRGAVLHEAEDVAAEGAVKGNIVEKVAASGGVAHTTWDSPGQWAQWRIELPAAGDYVLLIRAASEYDDAVRELAIDGETVQITAFGSTGGWCRTTDDWRWFRLATPGGAPLAIPLTAGAHTLRMDRLAGSMNLDLFALVPLK
ncbi:MAG: DUF4962 domain-containing protein [Armatimonadota bacterium]